MRGNVVGVDLRQINRSPYSEPIHQDPHTQDGKDLTLALQDGAHLSLENQINVKHGYQVGANYILWLLGALASGQSHEPLANYFLSELFDTIGDYPLIFCMTFTAIRRQGARG